MGTNYYARTAACPHCGRSDGDVHICKSLIMFQGYTDDGPLGAIRSWSDWRTALTTRSLLVFDEYGTEHPVAEFIAKVEATEPQHRRRQFDWMQMHYRTHNDWLDPDGFSFCLDDFS